jgi:hypothetical protein
MCDGGKPGQTVFFTAFALAYKPANLLTNDIDTCNDLN